MFFSRIFEKKIARYQAEEKEGGWKTPALVGVTLVPGKRAKPFPTNSLPPLLVFAKSMGTHTKEITTIQRYYDATAFLTLEMEGLAPADIEAYCIAFLQELVRE